MWLRFFTLLSDLLNSLWFWIDLIDVEAFKEAMKIHMLKIVRAKWKLSDDEFYVFLLELELSEHVCQVLFADSFWAITNVLEGNLQLLGVRAGHLCHS